MKTEWFFLTDLELAQLKLNHILTGRQNKGSWEEFCVGLHLKEWNIIC